MIVFNYHLSIKSLDQYRAVKEEDVRLQESSTTEGYVEPPIPPLTLLSLYQSNPYHASACNLKANDVLKSGWGITDPEAAREFRSFTDNCRPSFEYILLSALLDLQVFNYCALEVIRRDDGSPARLGYIPAHTIRVHDTGTRYRHTWDGVNVTYLKDYRYDGEVDPSTGGDVEGVGANEVIFIRLPNPICSYYGVPQYLPALTSILCMRKVGEYNYAFFDNFTIPSYVITVTGDYEDEVIVDSDGNPTGKTLLQELIEENFEYIRQHPHTPIVLSIPGGGDVEITFQPLNIDTKDLNFKEYLQEMRREIIAAHMIDPYRLGVGDVGALGGNLADVARRTYYESVVRPQQRIIASVFTDFIQTHFDVPDTVEFFFNEEGILESDVVKGYTSLVLSGVMTPREVRRRLFNDDTGPDVYYVPPSVTPKPNASTKRDPRLEEKAWQHLIKETYEKYRGRIDDVIKDQNLTNDQKREAIDRALQSFREDVYNEASKILEERATVGLQSAIHRGATSIPASGQNLGRYDELLKVSVDDMVHRLQSYLYKVIGRQG